MPKKFNNDILSELISEAKNKVKISWIGKKQNKIQPISFTN